MSDIHQGNGTFFTYRVDVRVGGGDCDDGDNCLKCKEVRDGESFLCLFTNENIETCKCETCKDNRSEAESYRLSGGRDWEADSIYGDAN